MVGDAADDAPTPVHAVGRPAGVAVAPGYSGRPSAHRAGAAAAVGGGGGGGGGVGGSGGGAFPKESKEKDCEHTGRNKAHILLDELVCLIQVLQRRCDQRTDGH